MSEDDGASDWTDYETPFCAFCKCWGHSPFSSECDGDCVCGHEGHEHSWTTSACERDGCACTEATLASRID